MVAVAKRKKQHTGFGQRLLTIRESKGLTRKQLGDLAGMFEQSIAKYEREASEPSWSVVLRLADALGAKLDDFRDAATGSPTESEAPSRLMGKRK
jgi:transcriptional regulator with XRE-family HTH domain